MTTFPSLFIGFLLLLSPSLSQQAAVLGYCDEWVALTEGFTLDGNAMTSLELLPGLPAQTVAYLGINGNIRYNGTAIQEYFPTYVYTNYCDDGNGGVVYEFEDDTDVEEENEIWLSFVNTPNQVEVARSQLADSDEVRSVIIHAKEGEEMVKALCCSYVFREVDTDSDSPAGKRELVGALVGLMGLVWAWLFASVY